MNGDKELQEFLNRENNNIANQTDILKEKTRLLLESYKECLDSYAKLPQEDPMRGTLKSFINKLIKKMLICSDQFDYILLDGGNENGNENQNQT